MRENATAETGKRKRRSKKRKGSALITLVAILFFAFALAALAGFVGDDLQGFFAGSFGFMGYAFFALALLATILKVFGAFRRRPKARTVAYSVVLALIVLLFLQVLKRP